MAGTVAGADDPAGLARLLADMQRRVTRLETQVRGQNTAVDFPGRFRYKDEQGVVRFELGSFDNGGIGTVQYGPDGVMLKPAEQASGTDPQTVTSTSYVDAGPPLSTTVTAGPSGSLLVILTAVVNAMERTVTSTGFMSFASTGGRVAAALDVNALQVSEPLVDLQTEDALGTEADHTHGQPGELAAGAEHHHLLFPSMGPPAARPFRGSRVVLLNGCDPRTSVVVTAKYRVSNGAGPYLFDDRSLIVVPL